MWQSLRGHGNDERRQILDRVSGFIERHGDGRFSDADDNAVPIPRTATRPRRLVALHEDRASTYSRRRTARSRHGLRLQAGAACLGGTRRTAAGGRDGERVTAQRIGGRAVNVYPILADKLYPEHKEYAATKT